ncbi:MAG: hypothetical protein GX111_05990 [Clostridiales bacterium]|jgi:hypothetical protein|nr:hypothetical protein [Clostridiales bacterium]
MQGLLHLDLAKTPFAVREARPMLLMQDDGVYFGLKPAGAALPFAQVFGSGGAKGILRISILSEGQDIPYTVNATAFETQLISDKGTVRFTLDKSANAMRIEGDVPQLRMSAGASASATTTKLEDGAEMNIGGRVIYKVRRGNFEFDDTWMLTRWSSTAPCLDITAADGKVDVACFELPADTEPPEVTKSFEACIAENKADFEAFATTLKPTDDLTAFELWSKPEKAGSIELAEESFLFCDAQSAFDRVLKSALAGKSGIVPKFAAAALRLRDDKLIDAISKDNRQKLTDALKEALCWWQTYRYDKVKGRYFYAYRAETGEANPPWFDEAPVYAPELQERLSQLNAAANL